MTERLLASTEVSSARVRRRTEVADFLHDVRPWIYRLALAIVGVPDLAEDVAQESLLKCWAARDSMREVSDLRAWTRTVVVRQAITRLKPPQPLETETVRPSCEKDVLVRMVLDSMPPLERAMLALAYFEQLSYGEMSEALGVPEGTVASRLYKAKESFRRLWGEQ